MRNSLIRLMGIVLLTLPACTSQQTEEQKMDFSYAQGNKQEIQKKEALLDTFLEQNNLDGVLLSSIHNFAWLTAGGDNHVVMTTEGGVASILYMKEKKYLLADSKEMPRFQDEEMTGLEEYEPITWDWHTGFTDNRKTRIVLDLIGGDKVGTDMPFAGLPVIEGALGKLRMTLLPEEQERFRWLGTTCAAIAEEVCRTIEPGDTEDHIRALTSHKLFEQGIIPAVVLIATDERVRNYRHPIAKDGVLDKYAMVVITARKWGMYIAVTRLVHFGELPEDLQTRLQICARVLATFLHHSRPAQTCRDVFAAGQQAYADGGYPDEWKLHHQGGPIAYKGRESIAHPENAMILTEGSAVAWNPSVQGTKCEDTALIQVDGIELVTDTGNWPRIAVDVQGVTYQMPDILIR